MLYKDGTLLDLQGNPIKSKAVKTVRHYQYDALENLTAGEAAFCRLAGSLRPRAGVRYVKQAIFYVAPGISFRCDFVYRQFRLIVEIDGHSHRGREEKDAWRDDVLLRLAGYSTFRLKDEDCLERWALTRVRLIDRLLACERGRKKELQAYRCELLADEKFLALVKEQGA